jgi:hypothetical protein
MIRARPGIVKGHDIEAKPLWLKQPLSSRHQLAWSSAQRLRVNIEIWLAKWSALNALLGVRQLGRQWNPIHTCGDRGGGDRPPRRPATPSAAITANRVVSRCNGGSWPAWSTRVRVYRRFFLQRNLHHKISHETNRQWKSSYTAVKNPDAVWIYA